MCSSDLIAFAALSIIGLAGAMAWRRKDVERIQHDREADIARIKAEIEKENEEHIGRILRRVEELERKVAHLEEANARLRADLMDVWERCTDPETRTLIRTILNRIP